jgi:uncharacterized small protein (DUF1192 family)
MAAFDDDARPAQPEQAFPRKLDSMSIDALHEYIRELEAEIARVRKDIEGKQGHQQLAKELFKK